MRCGALRSRAGANQRGGTLGLRWRRRTGRVADADRVCDGGAASRATLRDGEKLGVASTSAAHDLVLRPATGGHLGTTHGRAHGAAARPQFVELRPDALHVLAVVASRSAGTRLVDGGTHVSDRTLLRVDRSRRCTHRDSNHERKYVPLHGRSPFAHEHTLASGQ